MATQVDVCAQTLAPTHEPSIFERRSVSRVPRGPENQGATVVGHETTVSTSIPDPPRSPLHLPPNQPPEATAPDVSQRPGNGEIGNTETRPSQDIPSAVEIDPTPDPILNVWHYSVSVPGSRQKKRIYPKAEVKFGPWSQRQCHARFVFVKNELEALVNKHLDLHGLERRPVYALRMVGTAPTTTFPSIVITCREEDAKALQDLFRSRAENRLCIGKESAISQLRSSLGKQKEKDEPIPRLRLVYYRTRTSTVIRRASEEPLTAYSSNTGAYCGGLIQYQESSATLGLSIDIDDINATLTVGHLFSSKGTPDSSLVKGVEISPSYGSGASSLNNDEMESMDGLWEDDDEYDDFDEDDSLHPGRTEGNLPRERKFLGLPGLEKEKLAGQSPELWERVIPPVDLSPSSPYLDWALVRPVSHLSLFPSYTNSVFLDRPDGHHVFLDKIRQQPPSHLASVYMVSGVRGIIHGQILSGSSFLPSLPDQDYCEAWTIIFDNSDGLINGECGSIVVDRATNEVYGHVVGSDPLGHAYVVPLAHILGQVRACFEAKHVGFTQSIPSTGLQQQQQQQQQQHPLQPSATSSPSGAFSSSQGLSPVTGRFQVYPHDRHVYESSNPGTLQSLDEYGSRRHSGHGQIHAMKFPRDYNTPIWSPVEEFAQYVTQNHLKGRQGDDPNAKFISRSALERYWTLDKVKSILWACQPPINQHATQIIHGGFIRVFSILVFIGYPAAIGNFIEMGLDDYCLPFAAIPPGVWPAHLPYVKIHNNFRKHQWTFTPLDFQNGIIHKRSIDPRTILPVEYEAELGRNSGANDVAVIWKVKIHDECKGYIPMSTVVFKVYNKSDKTARDISSEADVYTLLPLDYDEHIVKCHGSFEQGDKSIIILEYAPRGSLLDFFETTRRRPTTDELRILWTELFKLLGALYVIHENGLPSSSAPIGLSGTLHDIQPANILVFPRDSDFEYNVYFKLADFGTTRIIKMISGGPDTQVGSNEGNRMYTAPESCPVYPFQDEVPKRVNPTVDVWALGAVFSETFIWSILGEPGRETYRKLRNEENQESKGMRGSGYEACFHNGTNSLKAVIKMHDDAVLETRRIDTVSPEISNVILKYMLQPLRDRLDAKSALSKADEALEQARQETQRLLTPRWRTLSPAKLSRIEDQMPQRDFSQSPLEYTALGVSREASISGSPPHNSAQALALQGLETPESQDPGGVNGVENPNVSNHRSLSLDPSQSHTGGYRPNLMNDAHPPTQTKRSATIGCSSNMSTPIMRRQEKFEVTGTGGKNGREMESSGVSRNPGEPNPMKQDISTFLSSPNSLTSSTTMHGRSPGSLNQLPHGRFSHETRSGVMMVPEIKPVTCREVYRMLERRNRQFFAMGSTSEALKVRGISEALSQISEVDGREQLILIDDFTSMRAHKDNVEETARVISYYVKRADPNNMELYFASNISVKHQCKNSSHVESIIRKHEFVDGKCAMGSCLASILNHVWVSLESSKSPVSIYVLTDGVWEAEDDEIGFAIAKSAQKLEKSNIFPPRIMIQFIRFGQDPNGIRRLKVLDDDLVELYNLRKYDIVDTKDCHAHVSDILLGSISRLSDATERGPTPAT